MSLYSINKADSVGEKPSFSTENLPKFSGSEATLELSSWARSEPLPNNIFLLNKRLKERPTCNLIVIDDFYENPLEVRNFALNLNFYENEYHPGGRTDKQYLTDHYDKIKMYLQPFGCVEHIFSTTRCSGTFQYNIASDKSWIHTDSVEEVPEDYESWAAIIYLTPNSPYSAGTGFFKFCDGTITNDEIELMNNRSIIQQSAREYKTNKWRMVSSVGNVFNRFILFKSDQLHMSLDYFGTDKYDGRLIQVFFLCVKFSPCLI
jgi:hypothetical protein